MTSQIALVAEILAVLDRCGVPGTTRVVNKAIELANECCTPVRNAEPGMGLAAWLDCDDVGASSKFMAHVCAGGPVAPLAYPYDPDDFGRCYRLIRAVEGLLSRLYKLRDHGPVWAAYIDHWYEMEAIYEEELPSGSAPKLYALMQSLRQAAKGEA